MRDGEADDLCAGEVGEGGVDACSGFEDGAGEKGGLGLL